MQEQSLHWDLTSAPQKASVSLWDCLHIHSDSSHMHTTSTEPHPTCCHKEAVELPTLLPSPDSSGQTGSWITLALAARSLRTLVPMKATKIAFDPGASAIRYLYSCKDQAGSPSGQCPGYADAAHAPHGQAAPRSPVVHVWQAPADCGQAQQLRWKGSIQARCHLCGTLGPQINDLVGPL